MFVHMILVHMVKMAVVKIIHVAVMANRGVPAILAMLMSVIGMMLLGAGRHDRVLSSLETCRDRWSLFLRSLVARYGEHHNVVQRLLLSFVITRLRSRQRDCSKFKRCGGDVPGQFAIEPAARARYPA